MAPKAASEGRFQNAKYEGKVGAQLIPQMTTAGLGTLGGEYAVRHGEAGVTLPVLAALAAHPGIATNASLALTDPFTRRLLMRAAAQTAARPAVEVMTGKPQ